MSRRHSCTAGCLSVFNFPISMTRTLLLPVIATASLVILPSCKSLNSSEERLARQHLETATRERDSSKDTILPSGADAKPADYVRFALLRHPAVFASYAEWKASVEAITPSKALPDPQLTFQADIQGTLMSLMPGVMFDLMLPGKRAAMAREVSVGSEVAYRNYIATSSRVADGVNKGLVEMAFIEESIRLKTKALEIAKQTQTLASAEYQTGMGMGTMETQLRALNDVERIKSELLSLDDQLRSVRARFKAALSLRPSDSDPDWPHPTLGKTTLPSREELWSSIQKYNTDLAKMRAMVDMAVAQESQARQGRIPDFTVGLMADVKQAPWMWRPTATMTLPIWRGKIQGQIESAKSRREAAQASVDAELLNMSAELARMLFMIEEADRMIFYIDTFALPSVQRTRASAQAAIQSGMGKASMIPEASGMEIAMLLERNAAMRERETAVTDLALMTAQLTRESGLVHLTP